MPLVMYVVIGVFLCLVVLGCILESPRHPELLAFAFAAGALAFLCFNHFAVTRDQEALRVARQVYPQLTITRVWHSGDNVVYYTNAARRGGRCNGEVEGPLEKGKLTIHYHGHRAVCRQVLSK